MANYLYSIFLQLTSLITFHALKGVLALPPYKKQIFNRNVEVKTSKRKEVLRWPHIVHTLPPLYGVAKMLLLTTRRKLMFSIYLLQCKEKHVNYLFQKICAWGLELP